MSDNITTSEEVNGEILREIVRKFRNSDYNRFIENHASMLDEIRRQMYKAAEIGCTETSITLCVDYEQVKFEKYIKQYYRLLDIDTEFNWSWLHRDIERINNTVNVKFSWKIKDD